MRGIGMGTLLGVMGITVLTGCWKGPQPVLEPAVVKVSVAPATAKLTVGRTLALTARIVGGPDGAVAWTVLEPQGGTVDGQGKYQAPATPGLYTVQATFPGAGGRTATAKLEVVPSPQGEILAPARILPLAEHVSARITPLPGFQYAWSITGGTLTQGETTPAIEFQAGAGPTVVLKCRITNPAGDLLRTTLEIPVAAPVSLSISPAQVTITAERAMKFGFKITGGLSLGVAWSLGEPGAGSLDDTGHYVAPAVPGSYSVRVTAADDPTRFATAKVKVVPKPADALFAPETFQPGQRGLRARVLEVAGMTYAWVIEGGTITTGTDASAITFDAGMGAKVVLKCRITNEAGDTILTERKLSSL